MWQEEVGCLEMLIAYYGQYEKSYGWKSYRESLREILVCHEEFAGKKKTGEPLILDWTSHQIKTEEPFDVEEFNRISRIGPYVSAPVVNEGSEDLEPMVLRPETAIVPTLGPPMVVEEPKKKAKRGRPLKKTVLKNRLSQSVVTKSKAKAPALTRAPIIGSSVALPKNAASKQIINKISKEMVKTAKQVKSESRNVKSDSKTVSPGRAKSESKTVSPGRAKSESKTVSLGRAKSDSKNTSPNKAKNLMKEGDKKKIASVSFYSGFNISGDPGRNKLNPTRKIGKFLSKTREVTDLKLETEFNSQISVTDVEAALGLNITPVVLLRKCDDLMENPRSDNVSVPTTAGLLQYPSTDAKPHVAAGDEASSATSRAIGALGSDVIETTLSSAVNNAPVVGNDSMMDPEGIDALLNSDDTANTTAQPMEVTEGSDTTCPATGDLGEAEATIGGSVGATDPVIGSAVGATDPVIGGSVGATDPVIGCAVGATEPVIGGSVGATDPVIGGSVGTTDSVIGGTTEGIADSVMGSAKVRVTDSVIRELVREIADSVIGAATGEVPHSVIGAATGEVPHPVIGAATGEVPYSVIGAATGEVPQSVIGGATEEVPHSVIGGATGEVPQSVIGGATGEVSQSVIGGATGEVPQSVIGGATGEVPQSVIGGATGEVPQSVIGGATGEVPQSVIGAEGGFEDSLLLEGEDGASSSLRARRSSIRCSRKCAHSGDEGRCIYCFYTRQERRSSVDEDRAKHVKFPDPRRESYESPLLATTSDGQFACSSCSLTFKTQELKDIHEKSHSQFRVNLGTRILDEQAKAKVKPAKKKKKRKSDIEATFSCNHCLRVFKKKSNKVLHERIHTQNKLLSCRYCSKTFVRQESLFIHERYHVTEKPHGCQFCSRTFSNVGAKVAHERSHSSLRPFGCTFCPRTFKTERFMLLHVREKHN